MRIVVASDHTALDLRAEIMEELKSLGHEVTDLGPFASDRTDYPLYGAAAGEAVASGEYDLGVIICGTGVGISLAANAVPGIRCCTCSEPYTAMMSRRHNDANMLAIGARVVGNEAAKLIVRTFVSETFEGDRHARRVDQLKALDADPHALDAQTMSIRKPNEA